MPQVEYVKPTIKLFYNEGQANAEVLKQISLGVEEEGIPLETVAYAVGSAFELALEASRESRLEVGLGADGRSAALHYAKLGEGDPLFAVATDAREEFLRALGANAARLVKRQPFKEIRQN